MNTTQLGVKGIVSEVFLTFNYFFEYVKHSREQFL